MYPHKEESDYNPPPLEPPTGVPVSVPPGTALNVQPRTIGPSSTGLCECGDDCRNCCITCLCPCITFGHYCHNCCVQQPFCVQCLCESTIACFSSLCMCY